MDTDDGAVDLRNEGVRIPETRFSLGQRPNHYDHDDDLDKGRRQLTRK